MTLSDTYAGTTNETLLEAFSSAPDRIRQAISDLSDEELHTHSPTRKWSIAEIVAHVVDSEIVGAMRARQVFAEPGASFPVYDQDAWADELAYASLDRSDLEQRLTLFRLLRETTGAIFWRASGEEWKRAGFHPERGEMTLRQILELYADHGERHLSQIQELREYLGKEGGAEIRLVQS